MKTKLGKRGEADGSAALSQSNRLALLLIILLFFILIIIIITQRLNKFPVPGLK